jgi:PAS domain S-box-containing protein
MALSIAQTKQIEAQQVHLLYSQAKTSLIGTAVNAAILIFVLWSVVPHTRLIAWLSVIGGLVCVRLFVVQCYWRSQQREQQTGWWRTLMVVSAATTGAVWGSTALFLYPDTSFVHQMFLIFVLGGLAAGAIGVMGSVKIVFLSFLVPMLFPLLLRLFFSGEELKLTMGGLLLFFALFVLATARHLGQSIAESLRLQLVNVDLIQDLSQAKDEAEQANLQLAASHSALSESEKRFRSLIEHTSDLITVVNEKGVVLYNSPSITRILGYETEELLGSPTISLFHPADEATVTETFRTLLGEPSGLRSFEFRIRHKDGSWRTFESIGQNLLEDTAVSGVVLNSRDITERKEVERLKDDLVSTVSHELRTPLTSLRGFAELMLTREFSREKQRHFLEVILNEGTRLTNLINDFLDIQRMESGKQTYHFGAVDLASLLHNALAVFNPEESHHLLHVEIPDNLPPVHADGDRLHQVLANLLSNAMKFSPNGGKITVRAHQAEQQLVIEVADEGVGIPPDVLPRLFQKFYRVDSRETRSIGGTGLGLALVKDIIAAHGGQVWVESQLNEGSSFFFSLSIAEPTMTSPQSAADLL